MSAPAAVVDSGALDRILRDPGQRSSIRALAARGWDIEIPTVTLAEASTGTGSDAGLNHLVRRSGTVDTDVAVARLAGALRHRVTRSRKRRLPSGIDAIVAAHAVAHRAQVVLTTDPRDLAALLSDHPDIGVEVPGRVG